MHTPEQKHPNGYAVDWGLHFDCFIIEEVQSYVFLFLMKDGEEKRAHGSPKKLNFFVIISAKNELLVQYILLKNAMEHSRYLCNFMQWKCVNSQKKLGELAEVAGTS